MSEEPHSNLFIAALESADPRKRENAANALIVASDPRAEEPLLEALHDHDAGVHAMAALAIGSLGSRRAVPRLLDLTQDNVRFARNPLEYKGSGIERPASFLGAALPQAFRLRL